MPDYTLALPPLPAGPVPRTPIITGLAWSQSTGWLDPGLEAQCIERGSLTRRYAYGPNQLVELAPAWWGRSPQATRAERRIATGQLRTRDGHWLAGRPRCRFCGGSLNRRSDLRERAHVTCLYGTHGRRGA